MNNLKIGASILSANFANLEADIGKVDRAGVDFLHIDVMDGHFVNNITIGPCVVDSISRVTSLPQYVHLMVENPAKYINSFADTGAKLITFHFETVKENDMLDVVAKIKDLGCEAGIAINPDTPEQEVYPYLDYVDLILVMSVFPGFSGQKFIEDVLSKIRNLRKNFDGLLEVDGGVNVETGRKVVTAGANVLVAASYIFKSEDIEKSVKNLKNLNKFI